MVAPKLLAFAGTTLVVGVVTGLLIASFVPMGAVQPPATVDGPGTVLVGADEPRTTPCAWAGDPFEGMDADQRAELTLIDACGSVRGTVQDILVKVRGETRTYHFTLLPDAGFTQLSNQANADELEGALMIEIEPADQGIIPRLHVGQHLEIQGPHVTDIDHAWNEIHPARIITVL
jgi:hypothetical protein